LAIDQVVIGERRRQELGDVQGLAESIDRYGLLHPIVVDADGQLVAGHRRLEACRLLGLSDIEARSIGELAEDERREIELEENLRRKDLTEYERSRNLTELATVAAELLKTELPAESTENSKRGRPEKPDSKEKIADRIGVPESTVRVAQTHAETADTYPFMQGWKQYQVLEAHEAIEKIPEDERPLVAALVDQPGIPAKNAIGIMRNLASQTKPSRERIYTLAESVDSRDRSLALTEAAAMPPMPDPRLALLSDARKILHKAAKLYPNDPANVCIEAAIDALKPAYVAVRESRHG
jgi:hypothetical protein